jgi:DNA modification methylase
MRLFEGVRFKFVATATPAPNEYIELLAYSAYLEIMDVSEAKTRFFKRNSEKADELTIHPHKEREFWLWISTWGLFIQRPSDLGYSDEGYILPELDVRWHEIPSNHENAGFESYGQGRLLRTAAVGVVDASREKRDSLPDRLAKLMEIRAEDPGAHRILWHDLEREREALERAIPDLVTVYGSQSDEDKERGIITFAEGQCRELAGKPQMLGSGVNFQRHCHWAIYLGIGFKFNDFVQSIHRLQRFLQTQRVRIDLIYTESERPVRDILERKWAQHRAMMATMSALIQEFGLSHQAREEQMRKGIGIVKPICIETSHYRLIHDDTVYATRAMEDETVGLILTSIPFSTQYEYSPNYADFGHSNDNAHFFEQMDYLTPHLLRVLKPGRMACIHVKDRIVPGGLTGLGFQTVYPFHAECIRHYTSHGFAYMGMVTIVTDVVRENNQTYRLGWTEQCKDATKMGVGMPEYVLLFRKPQTDTTRSYTDEPVRKDKPLVMGAEGPEKMRRGDTRGIVPGTGYSTARWQLDAHGFNRSSGDRLPTREEFASIEHHVLFKLWRKYNNTRVYDYEEHVAIAEALEQRARLPRDFMLFQPTSWHPEVWTDIARMRCLNGEQQHKGKQQHLCPMQFDTADRIIKRMSNPGDVVFDPFGGLMTVPYRAIMAGRFGVGHELNPSYFADGAYYCECAVRDLQQPSLFDLLDAEEDAGDALEAYA